jgi:hydroxymethylglutaryl-CoA synthase
MPLPPVGLHDLALALPPNRIDLAALAAHRIASDPTLEKHLARALATTGQRSMRYPSPTEDTVTLAAEALRALLDRRTDLDPGSLRFLTLGTETAVDMSKAGSSYVLGLLQKAGYPLPANLASFQVQQACAGGTLSLLTVAAFLQAAGRDGETGIVLTSDIARYKAPSTAEVTQGAGASALLVARNPDLIEFDLGGTGFASHDVDDFFRPLGSTIAKVRGGYSLACYHETLAEAFEDHCRRTGVSPADELNSIDAFFLHVPYALMPRVAMEKLLEKHLGLDAEGARTFLEARGFDAGLEATAEVGNLYTGSLYLGLAFGLANRVKAWGQETAGKKVLLASYGSGNTMAVFTGRMAPKARQTVDRWDLPAVLAGAVDAPFDDYQLWLDAVKTPETYPALAAAHPPKPGRFALKGIREDGYREYGTGDHGIG